MNCPVCGSKMSERTTSKGVLFLVCAKWPRCRCSGTPELIELVKTISGHATSFQDQLIAQKEKHAVAFEEVWSANERRRAILDELFRCCICNGWFPEPELISNGSVTICNRCVHGPAAHEQLHSPVDTRYPIRLGSFVGQLAQLRIHQSKLSQAKTAEEREAIRKQAQGVIQ